MGEIAVIGATGQQGRAVVGALRNAGAQVRALTRHVDSPAAQELAGLGVSVAHADLTEPMTLQDALTGVDRLFVMATFAGDRGIDGEIADGKAVADLLPESGVEYVLYSSVGGAERDTGIPHFESKRQIELAIEATGVRSTFLRPVFFMENFASFATPTVQDGTIVVRLPMPGDIPIQLIAVSDIGRAAAALLLDPADAPHTLEIGGDELTGDEIAELYGRRFELPARYEALDPSTMDDDGAAMFRWFASGSAYDADFGRTGDLTDGPLRFADWLARDGVLGDGSR
jgi:uncharacterized protein YbjT (DUF2867 family)